MAFSTTKQIKFEQRKCRVRDFFMDCIYHIEWVSKKPVTAKFLRHTYGPVVGLDDLEVLENSSSFAFMCDSNRIGKSDLQRYLTTLETL